MDPDYVESISASIVREYLSKKGLRETLDKLEEELPRDAGSITKRSELVSALHADAMMDRNMELMNPHKTVLEVISQNLVAERLQGLGQLDGPSDWYSGSRSEESLSGSTHRLKASRPRHITPSSSNGDLVLEDDLEDSETFLGEGKAGLLGKQTTEDFDMPLHKTNSKKRSRPTTSRFRGMSGPISSNLDDRDHQRAPRVKSGRVPSSRGPSSCAQPLGVGRPAAAASQRDEPSSPLDAILNSSATSADTGNHGNSLAKNSLSLSSARLISRSDRESLHDVLSKSSDVQKPTSSRLSRHAGGVAKRPNDPEDFEDYEYDVQKSSISGDKPPSRPVSSAAQESKTVTELLAGSSSSHGKSTAKANKMGDVEFGDMDDLESELNDLDLKPRSHIPSQQQQQHTLAVETKPIDIHTAIELKTLILGSASQQFNGEWIHQSFTFCDLPRLQYGIVQRKGGPCGVLASVQAQVIQHLLFAGGKKGSMKSLDPTRQQRSEALAVALATILWRAGEEQRAVVTIPGMKAHFPNSSKCRSDDLTEKLSLNTLTSKEDLIVFIRQNISLFELDGCSGVVLALYSAILSRTVKGVRADMDEPTNKLMGMYGYCSQEMVNLFLVGHAASNVFNDVVELDSGDDKMMILKGVSKRSDIGLLSLFEHYKSCQVGTYLKTPRYPIWVICSESHFSVMFAIRRELLSDWKVERNFDLFYYDGLGKQEQEVKLTIRTSNKFFVVPSDDDLVPPLDRVIRTKWPGSEVDWNGTEPLL